MPAIETPPIEQQITAPDFNLLATDRKTYRRDDLLGKNGLLIAFLCNHCPYVKAIIERFVQDAHAAKPLLIGIAAIMSNDTKTYPQDSFENMAIFAKKHAFPFPYLYDEEQEVARAYDAVCTPDFFLFDSELKLVYRGRLDCGRLEEPPADAKRELLEAMRELARDPAEVTIDPKQRFANQFSSIGCSIKWKTTAGK